MRLLLVSALAVASLSPQLVSPVSADGLASMHAKVHHGSYLCFADHMHRGESRPMPTEAAALADAARSWESLTVLEYGAEWGRFANSADKDVRCGPRGGFAGPTWICQVASRPCMVTAPVARPAAVTPAGPRHRLTPRRSAAVAHRTVR